MRHATRLLGIGNKSQDRFDPPWNQRHRDIAMIPRLATAVDNVKHEIDFVVDTVLPEQPIAA
jgi:hypothetical protein